MGSTQTAALHVPYGKWRKYIGGNIPEVEQRIEAEGLVIKAPSESTVNDLGRLVELTGSTKSIVRVMRSLLHRLAGPDPLSEIYHPEETCWQIQHQGQRTGPFRGSQFISWQPTSPCGLPHDLKSHTPVVHTKSRVLLPMWLLLAHFDTPSFERAVLPSSESPSVSKSSGSNTNSYVSMPSSTLTGGTSSTGGSAGSGQLHITTTQLGQHPQPHMQLHSPSYALHNQQAATAAVNQPTVGNDHPGMQRITYPCNYDDGDEEMWAADLAMDPEAASALAESVSSHIHNLRSVPDFEAMVTAMELDQEDLDASTQYIPDIMDYVADHVLAGLMSLPGMAADTDMARPQSLVHLHFVVDTSFVCHPAGMRFLRVLQERFAPKAPETADGAAGRASSASAYGFVVSTVVPRKVYGELDGLKAADGRGDVARYARVALGTLLNGFRARDGFLALQSREEFVQACKQSGEDHPDTDSSVVQCAAQIRNMFHRKQAGNTSTEPTNNDQQGASAEASTATGSHAGRDANSVSAEDSGIIRRVIVLSNDNGVCIMAEAEHILTARQSDLPPSANTAMLIKFLTHLAADGQLPDLATIAASLHEGDRSPDAQIVRASSSGTQQKQQQQHVHDVSTDHGHMEEDEAETTNSMQRHPPQRQPHNHGQAFDPGQQTTSQFLPREQLPTYQTAPVISYDEFDDDYGAPAQQGRASERQHVGLYQPQGMAGRDPNYNRNVLNYNQWPGPSNQRPVSKSRSNNTYLSYDDYDDDYSYADPAGGNRRDEARNIHELMSGYQQGPRHAPYHSQFQPQSGNAEGHRASRTASLPAHSVDPALLGAAHHQMGAQQRMHSVPIGAAALNNIAEALRENQGNPQYLAAAITRLTAMQLQHQHQQKAGNVVVQTQQFHQAVAQAAASGHVGATPGTGMSQQTGEANHEQQFQNVQQAQPGIPAAAATTATSAMATASSQPLDAASMNALLQQAQLNGAGPHELIQLQAYVMQNPSLAPALAAALAGKLQAREQMQRRASLDSAAHPNTQQAASGSGTALYSQGSLNTAPQASQPIHSIRPPQTQADLVNGMLRSGSQGQGGMQPPQPNVPSHTQSPAEESLARSKWQAYAKARPPPPQPYNAELFMKFFEILQSLQPKQFTVAAVDEQIKKSQELMTIYSHENEKAWQHILQTHQKQHGQPLTAEQMALLQKHVQALVVNQVAPQLAQQQQQLQQEQAQGATNPSQHAVNLNPPQNAAPRSSDSASTTMQAQAATPFQAAAVHPAQSTDPLQAHAMMILLQQQQQQQQERQAAQQRQEAMARLNQQVKQQVVTESQQDSDDEYGYPTEQRSNPATRRSSAPQAVPAAYAVPSRPQHAQHGPPRLPGALRQQPGGVPGRGRGGPAVSATAMLHEMHAQATGGTHIVHNPGTKP